MLHWEDLNVDRVLIWNNKSVDCRFQTVCLVHVLFFNASNARQDNDVTDINVFDEWRVGFDENVDF